LAFATNIWTSRGSDQELHQAVDLNRLQLKPSPWPLVDLAVSLIGVNRLEDAKKNLDEALRYDAKLPQARYQLGRILEMQGDFDGALDASPKQRN